MRVAETVDGRIRVMIASAAVPTIQAGVRTELHHPERCSGARIGVSVPSRANERVHPL